MEADRANVSGLHSAGAVGPVASPIPLCAGWLVAACWRASVHLQVECAEVCAAAPRCACLRTTRSRVETRRCGGVFAAHPHTVAGWPQGESSRRRCGRLAPVTCDTGHAGRSGRCATRARRLESRRKSWSSLRPVLKHGPRSLAYARVIGWKTPKAQ